MPPVGIEPTTFGPSVWHRGHVICVAPDPVAVGVLVGTPRDAAIWASERPALSWAASALSLSPRLSASAVTSPIQLCLSAWSGLTFPAASCPRNCRPSASRGRLAGRA